MTRILITGVRGKTGVPLADLLAARPDVEVLGGSGDPSSVTLDGVRPTAFSWDDPAGWDAALAGVDAVYVVRPDRPDAPALLGDLLAATAPATRVVLLSERRADSVGPDGWAARTEAVVRRSGRPWTVLRPGWFMQVLTDPRFYLDQVRAGELPFAAGGADLAWIDARDIAAVAGLALVEDGHAGQTYELTGPESVSLPRTAALLAAAAGHAVAHRETTVDEALEGMAGFERELTELTFARVRDGVFSDVTDTVARVTGRPARTLESFLTEHAGDLARD